MEFAIRLLPGQSSPESKVKVEDTSTTRFTSQSIAPTTVLDLPLNEPVARTFETLIKSRNPPAKAQGTDKITRQRKAIWKKIVSNNQALRKGLPPSDISWANGAETLDEIAAEGLYDVVGLQTLAFRFKPPNLPGRAKLFVDDHAVTLLKQLIAYLNGTTADPFFDAAKKVRKDSDPSYGVIHPTWMPSNKPRMVKARFVDTDPTSKMLRKSFTAKRQSEEDDDPTWEPSKSDDDDNDSTWDREPSKSGDDDDDDDPIWESSTKPRSTKRKADKVAFKTTKKIKANINTRPAGSKKINGNKPKINSVGYAQSKKVSKMKSKPTRGSAVRKNKPSDGKGKKKKSKGWLIDWIRAAVGQWF